MDEALLKLLVCPETRQSLRPAGAAVLQALNERIARGELRNRGGAPVDYRFDGGLARADGKVLYPVREGIPVMLVEESVDLAQLEAS